MTVSSVEFDFFQPKDVLSHCCIALEQLYCQFVIVKYCINDIQTER